MGINIIWTNTLEIIVKETRNKSLKKNMIDIWFQSQHQISFGSVDIFIRPELAEYLVQ